MLIDACGTDDDGEGEGEDDDDDDVGGAGCLLTVAVDLPVGPGHHLYQRCITTARGHVDARPLSSLS